MASSAIATSLLQRLAKKVRKETGGYITKHQWAEEACSSSSAWWKMLLGQPCSNVASSREYGVRPAYRDESNDPVDFFSARVGDADFWSGPESHARFSHPALERFRAVHQDQLSAFRTASYVDSTADTEVRLTPQEIARQKYAGILSLPTLAKYLNCILDLECHAEGLLGKSAMDLLRSGNRVYGKVAARFRKDNKCNDLQECIKVPHKQTAQVVKTENRSPIVIEAPREKIWTAFTALMPEQRYSSTLVPSTGGSSNGVVVRRRIYFGPRFREEGSTAQHADGILKMGIAGRYDLSTLDTTSAAERILASSLAEDQSKHEDEQTRAFPELLTRGICLHDSDSVKEEERRRNNEESKRNSNGEKVLYGDDLIIGYRIDVSVARRGDEEGKSCLAEDRWRTLMGRTLKYGDIDQAFMAQGGVQRRKLRDDGVVRRCVRTDGDGKNVKYQDRVHEELFVWTGESLAIPHLEAKWGTDHRSTRIPKPYILICPESLTVNLAYDLPSKNEPSHRKAPPLREGYGYVFGARLVFMNGCSLGFDAAVKRYIGSEPDLVKGKEGRKPFVYCRRCAIHAPDVLLPSDDRLVAARNLSTEAPGETISELVVRSGDRETITARRVIVPPRVTFDLAEQGGLFDFDYSSRPKGAFSGIAKPQLSKTHGAFPIARAGKWEDAELALQLLANQQSTASDPRVESRGSVFVLDITAKRPIAEFYVDPMARYANFFLKDCTDDDGTHQIEFWPERSTSVRAKPIVVEVKKARKSKYTIEFDKHDAAAVLQYATTPGEMGVKKVSIALSPGAVTELEVSCVPPEDLLNRLQPLVSALEMLKNVPSATKRVPLRRFGLWSRSEMYRFLRSVRPLLSEDHSQCASACQQLLSEGALTPVTTKRILRLVHAVSRPQKPRFLTATNNAFDGAQLSGDKCRFKRTQRTLDLRFFPVVITVNKDAPSVQPQQKAPSNAESSSEDNLKRSWETYLKRYDSVIDRRYWPSQEGGLTTFFVGELLVDRLVTGSLRCDSQWKEYTPSSIRNVKGRWKVDAKMQSATLFEIKNLERTKAKNEEVVCGLDKLDLVHDNATMPRALAHPFVDGRARHLSLQLLATSRFTSYFSPGESREAYTQELGSTSASVWLPATFRPDSPVVDRILPVFHWHDEVHDGGQEIRWTRETSLRIVMGQDWYSSGESEILALICWPENLFGTVTGTSSRTTEDQEAPIVARNGMKNLDPEFAPASRIDISDKGVGSQAQKENSDADTRVDSGKVQAPPKTQPESDKNRVLFRQYVTRWGSDPIRLSGQLEEVISADRFQLPFEEKVSRNQFGESLLLSLPESQDNVTNSNQDAPAKHPTLPVCIVTYNTSLDEHEGYWYADIKLDHGSAYYPFIQLGLARYQRHSASGLELSYPVATYAQVPPRREGKLTFKDDRNVTVVLRGIGYHQSETGPEHDAERSKTDFPVLDVKLMCAVPDLSAAAGHFNWQPVSNGRTFVSWPDQRPIQRGAELLWTLEVRLPESRRLVRYGLLIEEYEYMAQDKVIASENISAPRFTTEITKRGPLFSKIVDLTLKPRPAPRCPPSAPTSPSEYMKGSTIVDKCNLVRQ